MISLKAVLPLLSAMVAVEELALLISRCASESYYSGKGSCS
jgi:hypothetical protein